MGQGTSNVTVKDLEMDADSLDPLRAAAIYQEHGALVVRGLMREHVEAVRRDIMASVDKAMSLYDRAEKIPEGWLTPDGTLWLPAPEGFERDRQVMVSSCRYCNSAALFHSAFEPKLVSLTTAILGPNVELYLDGQCLVKEPVGGHAKHLHQDAGYFEHKYEGPVGALSYAVDTDVKRGALHVVPGSHRMDVLEHVDTESHLGLDPNQWRMEDALPIEGKAGDTILFHVKTIHGSPPNHAEGPRPVFIHRYRAANDYVVISGPSVAKRAESAKATAKAKKENQEGFMVAGFRQWDDERAENQ